MATTAEKTGAAASVYEKHIDETKEAQDIIEDTDTYTMICMQGCINKQLI